MSDYLKRFSLINQVAFITGGYGLLGGAIAEALLEAGANVVILGTRVAGFYNRFPKKIFGKQPLFFEKFDVTNLEVVDQAIPRLRKQYGGINIWVNSAYPRTADWGSGLTNLKLSSWNKNIIDQLSSYGWICRRVCLEMTAQKKGGSVINLASIYGLVGYDFQLYQGTNLQPPIAYSAIKGEIINLTRTLASYFGKDQIRVNALCPGGVFNQQEKKFVKNYTAKTPLGRMARAEEIGSAVLFLASNASSYVTGSVLVVDGGWTAI